MDTEFQHALRVLQAMSDAKDKSDHHLATLVTNIMRQDYDGDLKNWLAAMKDYCLSAGLVKGGDA